MRTLMLWCPDWPVLAAAIIDGVDPHRPVAVLHANRVVVCSPAARAEGVRRGLRRREAQGRCPHLQVVAHDPARDARAFEPVLAAVEELAPGVEVIRPGAAALAARGPSQYYGGDEAAAEKLVEQVALRCQVEMQAGVADGVFAALIAARAGRIIPPGGTPGFLADMSIDALDRPDLTDLLRRLGIRTLADFAALPPGDVLARFGFDAAYAHQLASGEDERPLAIRKPPPDLVVTGEYDPPLERVDMAAFAARALAERLAERLAGHGFAATRLGIEAHTAAGEELHRVWRHDGLLDASALADRVRWQLDGWLTGAGRGSQATPGRPTSGGPGPTGVRSRTPVPPWPGQLPAPAPATVLTEPTPVTLYADHGDVLAVDARLALTGVPASLGVGREPCVAVTGWAGPWPAQERWWAPDEAVCLVRFQVSLADGRAMLLSLGARGWQVEAVYD
jgi:protein ImuB